MRVLIDRSTWRCGDVGPTAHGQGQTRLQNQLGFRCCLGFYSIAADVLPKDIVGIISPRMLFYKIYKLLQSFPDKFSKLIQPLGTRCSNSKYADLAMQINDSTALNDQQREEQLIALAARNGDEWVFTGEYPSERTVANL